MYICLFYGVNEGRRKRDFWGFAFCHVYELVDYTLCCRWVDRCSMCHQMTHSTSELNIQPAICSPSLNWYVRYSLLVHLSVCIGSSGAQTSLDLTLPRSSAVTVCALTTQLLFTISNNWRERTLKLPYSTSLSFKPAPLYLQNLYSL